MKLSLGKCWGLLIFDIIGLTLSGYAFLLGFQILETLPDASGFIILMGIFIGIKVIVLSLYDLNRELLLKNIPFIAGLISVIGNGIVFVICWFFLPGVPLSFFIGLAICDFLIVVLCHYLWWVLVGKDEEVQEIKTGGEKRRSWLADVNEEESEYDSIFTTLLEDDKKNHQNLKEPSKPGVVEDEKRYQTSDFLKDIKLSLEKDPGEEKQTQIVPVVQVSALNPLMATPLPDTMFSSVQPQEPSRTMKELFEELPSVEKNDESDINSSTLSQSPEKKLFEDLSGAEKDDVSGINSNTSSDSSAGKKNIGDAVKAPEETVIESEEDFLAIERRLGYLFYEIEKSMKETQLLQSSVSEFHQTVETYAPISGDEKIIAAGNMIREKLKAIIDKQFVVDEVLDDLIRLSRLINNRIDDLDVIEAGLNQRKMALDQKDILTVEEQKRSFVDDEIEIMPEEVVLENLDSEFIIAEDDYETIRRYLTQNLED